MWRTCGGFAVGYFQPAWIARNGAACVFGIQAATVCAVVLMTIIPVIFWERKRRMNVAENVEAE